MKFTLALLFSMVLCTSVLAKQHDSFLFKLDNLRGEDDNNHTANQWTREQILNWYVAGSRGLWVGFVKGLYNVQTVNISDHCLSIDTTSRIYRIIDAFTTFKVIDMFHGIIDSANIINNINECEFEKIEYDLTQHCETNDCSGQKIFSNLTVKVFNIIDKLNSIAETYQEQPDETDEEINQEGETIGMNIGMIVRMVLDIQTL